MTASPDFFAESAKNPTSAENAHVGLPSELREAVKSALPSIAIAIEEWLFNGAADDEAASAIADLIRPAFEAKDAEIERWRRRWLSAEAELQSAEAKLAQAGEAMEPFDDALGEDDEGYGGGLTVVMKWGACTDYSITLEDLRDLRKACRTASASARG